MVLMNKMTPDFFIQLTFAVHRVASTLPPEEPIGGQIKSSANALLASLLLVSEGNPFSEEQRMAGIPKAIREAGTLLAYLSYAKRMAWVNPQNFAVLEKEYTRVGEFLRKLHQDMAGQTPKAVRTPEPVAPKRDLRIPESRLNTRQARILELMRNKDKTQVWELQKLFPDVTKRTLRRDMDDLLKRSLILRQGEWNEVSYQIR
jgi:hypothetical protein